MQWVPYVNRSLGITRSWASCHQHGEEAYQEGPCRRSRCTARGCSPPAAPCTRCAASRGTLHTAENTGVLSHRSAHQQKRQVPLLSASSGRLSLPPRAQLLLHTMMQVPTEDEFYISKSRLLQELPLVAAIKMCLDRLLKSRNTHIHKTTALIYFPLICRGNISLK